MTPEPQQPNLADQLKSIARQALDLQVTVTRLVDFCEAQAKEIAMLRAQTTREETVE